MAGNGHSGSVLVAGSANIDFVVRVPHIPAPGETVLGGDLTVVPGGKGANQAVACARAGGAPTTFLAALGDDPYAPLLTASLAAAGVGLHIVQSDRPTGAALITVSDDASNAITVAPGANADLAAEDLPSLDGVSWLVMQLEIPLATVVSFARSARGAGVRVLLNAAPAQTLPPELLSAVDVLVVNEEELALVSGGRGSIADRLAALGIPCAIVTLGERGSCALVDGEYIVQPAFPVVPVDTTGAGDTFCGTLAAALSSGLPFAPALRQASAAAALATTRAGAQASIPSLAEVGHLLEHAVETDFAGLSDYCGAISPSRRPQT